jgi:chemotaxis protein MotB
LKRLQRNSKDEGDKTAGWLTTFNDLVTLLMVFFVLLFTMSTIDTQKMQDFQYALQSGLGILETGSKVAISVKRTQPVDDMSHIMTQAEGERDRQGSNQPGGKWVDQIRQLTETDLNIQVAHTDEGTRLSFEDQVLFDFGRAAINPTGFVFLDTIANVLNKIPYSVRVEGHTDNVPIETRRFPSNWELSVARAVSVVKYFAEVGKIDPRRLSAVGYGESRPVAGNDTLLNRAKNRRVEILLLTEGKEENVE